MRWCYSWFLFTDTVSFWWKNFTVNGHSIYHCSFNVIVLIFLQVLRLKLVRVLTWSCIVVWLLKRNASIAAGAVFLITPNHDESRATGSIHAACMQSAGAACRHSADVCEHLFSAHVHQCRWCWAASGFALCLFLTHACVFSAFVYLPPPLLTGVIYLSPSVCLSVSGIAQNAAGGCSWNLRIGLHRGTEKSWLNFRIDLEHILDAVEIVSLSVGQL